MDTIASASADAPIPPSEDAQALALWTFVHLRVPRFTSEVALEVIRSLTLQSEDNPKKLAKRLRLALAEHGVHLKHTHALQAASRLLGHNSWHSAERRAPRPKLRLTLMSEPTERLISSWRELAPRLCAACDVTLQESHAKVVEVRFGPDSMTLSVPLPKGPDATPQTEVLPVLVVNPLRDPATWLDDAPPVLERLRRFLEESGRAVLDGVAVLQLCTCARPPWEPPVPQPIRPTDACNSELILIRQDNELDTRSAIEIARGDELTCWSQLELATKDQADCDITLEEGAWQTGGGRYVWQISTIHPKDPTPGLVLSELGPRDSERLFRRYQLARRIFSGRLTHHAVTKRIEYLSQPTDWLRVDLHKVLLALARAGLSWDAYCEESGHAEPMQAQLPIGFVLSLLERLKLPDPNAIIARPTRAELVRADDDRLLRTLMPRVDHVTYRLPYGVREDVKSVVRDAIEEFSASIQLQRRTAMGTLTIEGDPLPYLVYAGDGEELRLRLAEQNLVMHVGVIPRLYRTEGVIEQSPNMWSFALGFSLYLDLDHQEERPPTA